ncbi:DUF974-domain-containing protein [Suillus decipiens]|nr:DUF974-domain-containing protein [Suillus decipiens]
MDAQGHLLSLKVMRVSRPSLASAWQPFYSSSPSFSAHSTASILSLQGKTPLPGHPKTLRDLTQASEFLTLPASFGAIQLGETFSSCICINNETNIDVEGVNVRVEIQTANSKILVAELGGPDFKLAVGDSLEYVAHHEVKELGHHVLACIVSYHLHPSYRHAFGASDSSNEATFSKFYKFAVTNPLSVKTKVHTPRSPSALMTSSEREKVFLEVHIQNLTQDAMWFERMEFECTEGWSVVDANTTDDEKDQRLFSGSMALMQPQAIRQYIYILTPISSSSFPVVHPAGSVIHLGRIDISWRSQFGEPGRLLTSMLSRRFPGPPPVLNSTPAPVPPLQHPVSALPLYLQRTVPSAPSSPARPRSPQLSPSRPSSPTPAPYRPGSPFRTRPMSGPSHPQSPVAGSISNMNMPTAPNQQPAPSVPALVLDVEVDVIINHIARESITVERPFKIAFTATVSAALPNTKGKQRVITLAVQHIQYPRATAIAYPEPFRATETISSRFSSLGLTSATSMLVTPMQSSLNIASENLLAISPEKMLTRGEPTLPTPYFDFPDEEKRAKLKGCVYVGSSTQFLDPITLTNPSHAGRHEDSSDNDGEKAEGSQEFELTFLPVQTGFVRAGGLRILLVRDELVDIGTDQATHRLGSRAMEARTMKELDVVAELWVHS